MRFPFFWRKSGKEGSDGGEADGGAEAPDDEDGEEEQAEKKGRKDRKRKEKRKKKKKKKRDSSDDSSSTASGSSALSRAASAAAAAFRTKPNRRASQALMLSMRGEAAEYFSAVSPAAPADPDRTSLLIAKDPSEPLGLNFREPERGDFVLIEAREGLPAARSGGTAFVGRMLTHVEDDPIRDLVQLRTAAAGRTELTLRFARAQCTTAGSLEVTVRAAEGLPPEGATGPCEIEVSALGAQQRTRVQTASAGGCTWEHRLGAFSLGHSGGCVLSFVVVSNGVRVASSALEVDADVLAGLVACPRHYDLVLSPSGSLSVDLRAAAAELVGLAWLAGVSRWPAAQGREISPPLAGVELFLQAAQGLRASGVPLSQTARPSVRVSVQGLPTKVPDTVSRPGRTAHPEWNERFVWALHTAHAAALTFTLTVSNTAKGNEFVGQHSATVSGSELRLLLLRPKQKTLRLVLGRDESAADGARRGSDASVAGREPTRGSVYITLRTFTESPFPGWQLPNSPRRFSERPDAKLGTPGTSFEDRPPATTLDADELRLKERLDGFFRSVDGAATRDTTQMLISARGIENLLCDKIQARHPERAAEVEFLRTYWAEKNAGTRRLSSQHSDAVAAANAGDAAGVLAAVVRNSSGIPTGEHWRPPVSGDPIAESPRSERWRPPPLVMPSGDGQRKGMSVRLKVPNDGALADAVEREVLSQTANTMLIGVQTAVSDTSSTNPTAAASQLARRRLDELEQEVERVRADCEDLLQHGDVHASPPADSTLAQQFAPLRRQLELMHVRQESFDRQLRLAATGQAAALTPSSLLATKPQLQSPCRMERLPTSAAAALAMSPCGTRPTRSPQRSAGFQSSLRCGDIRRGVF